MRFIRLSADSSLQLLIAVRFPSDPTRLAGRLPIPRARNNVGRSFQIGNGQEFVGVRGWRRYRALRTDVPKASLPIACSHELGRVNGFARSDIKQIKTLSFRSMIFPFLL
jgi:hypothetical protein